MGEQAKNKMELIDDGFDCVLLGASRLHDTMRRCALDDHAQAMTRISATEQEMVRQATVAYMTAVRDAVAAANDVRTAALAAAHQQAQSEREQADQARADLLRHADGVVCDASDQIEAIRDRLSAKLTELAMQNPDMVVLLDEALAEMGMPIEVVPLSAVRPSDDDVNRVASLYGENLEVARAKLTSALAVTGGDFDAARALLVAEAT